VARADTQRIDDMLQATSEIADVVSRGRRAYDHDIALRRAVERCLEILGESSKMVTPDTKDEIEDVPWSDLARIRDRLNHHHHRIDPDQIWTIVAVDVPAVAETLRKWRPKSPYGSDCRRYETHRWSVMSVVVGQGRSNRVPRGNRTHPGGWRGRPGSACKHVRIFGGVSGRSGVCGVTRM